MTVTMKRAAAQHHNAGRDAERTGRPAESAVPVLMGRKPVLEAVLQTPERIDAVLVRDGKRMPDVERILDACREAGVRFRLVPQSELDRLAPGVNQGVAARLTGAAFVELEAAVAAARAAPLPVLVVLDQVQDPGNVGTLARTLYALGGGGLVVPKDGGAHLGGAAAKASAGALARLPVARVVNVARALDELAEAGFAIYCTGSRAGAGADAVGAFDFTPSFPCALVLGGEEKGVRPNVAKRCETRLEIPFAREFDSLNVAQAGAILLGLFAKSRG